MVFLNESYIYGTFIHSKWTELEADKQLLEYIPFGASLHY
jgi:hypothetical protein